MRGQQEVEKQIKIKLSGQNRRSYLDIAQKQPSSILVADQDDLESKNNQSKLPTQLKIQVQAISRQSDLSLFADRSPMSKISSSNKIEGKNNSQKYKSAQEQLQFVKISESQENQANRSWQSPQNRSQHKQVHQQQLKTLKSAYHNRQKKHSMHIKKREKNSLLTTAQKSEYLHSIMKSNIIDFINKYTLFGRYKQMKEKSRKLLGDLSDKFTYMPQNKKYSAVSNFLWMLLQLIKKLEKFVILIFENLPLFNPENKLRICVNGLIACYNCFYLFTISLTLFFKADFQEYHNLFHYVAIAAWIFEMFLQMNTATYHECDFITDRKTIFRIYVKEYFFFEVLPLIFEGKSSSNAAINILLHLPLLLKLKGMSIILSKLEFLILQHVHKPYIMQILKQLLYVLLLVHFMACSYATLAYFEKNFLQIDENWIDLGYLSFHQFYSFIYLFIIFFHVKLFTGKIQKADSFWWTNYIEAQLWAFYTLSNSYSSSVFSQYEYAFTSFWMLISYVFFAYNLMTLKGIMLDMNSANENYKKDLNLLNRYMKRKKIDLELQRAINSHVLKQYEQEVQTQFEAEKEALKKLSPHMRNKLVMESNKNIATQFPFCENLSQQTILSLYQIMEEECYAEGQHVQIFDKNTQEYFVFLVLSGRVEVIQNVERNQLESISSIYEQKNMNVEDKYKKNATVQSCQKSICYLKEGQIFGEYEFFINAEFPYVIKCQQKTVLIKISNIKFYEILKQNQNDLQKFLELKQRITFNKQIELLKSQCFICKQKDHHFINCYQTHFFKSPYFLITKNNFFFKQERKNHTRGIKKTQKYIIELTQQQILSNNGDNEMAAGFTQSQLSPIKDDETSIFKQQNNQGVNQSSNKFKFSKEESKSEQSDSQEQETQAKEKANDEVLFQIKNALSNLGSKRSSMKSSISIMKQQARSIERQDSNTNQEKMEIIKKQTVNEEKLTTQNTDERNINNHLNSSQNNLSEHNQSQTILYPMPLPQSQFNKSGNQLPSLQVIKKQNQYQHQIYLESIPELDVKHNIQQDQYNRHSDQSQSSLFRGNSLIPLNTAQAKRYSINKNRNSLNLNSPLKFDDEVFKLFWNRSSLYWEFDKLANFIYFFPQQNFKNILKNTKRLKEKRSTIKYIKKQII
ncbi:hypothetical protein ABPG74_020225 [Tetrahymena malaccensis]